MSSEFRVRSIEIKTPNTELITPNYSGRNDMKKIEAIIKPFKLDEVKNALTKIQPIAPVHQALKILGIALSTQTMRNSQQVMRALHPMKRLNPTMNLRMKSQRKIPLEMRMKLPKGVQKTQTKKERASPASRRVLKDSVESKNL